MLQWIAKCRDAFGAPPREFSAEDKAAFRIWPPAWCFLPPSALLSIYLAQDKLRDRGRIVLGKIVQANDTLFRPGGPPAPANVVYGDVDDIDLLRAVARDLFALKGTRPKNTGLIPCAEALTNELKRTMKLPIPAQLSRGAPLYLTTIMVHREHLPRGYLCEGYFPLLVLPEETRATMILPGRFWPPELVAAWQESVDRFHELKRKHDDLMNGLAPLLATIKVERVREMFAVGGTFEVYIDDRRVGDVKLSKPCSCPVVPGEHSVYAKFGWSKSDVVRVNLQAGESAQFICKRNKQATRFMDRMRAKELAFVALVLLSTQIPALKNFLEANILPELILLFVLGVAATTYAVGRSLSKKPGAFLSLERTG